MRFPFLIVSLFYAAYFAVPAIQLAFYPLWLKERGYDVVLIAYALALPWILRPFIGPYLAFQVDKRGGANLVMAALLTLAAIGIAALSLLDGISVLILTGLAFLMWSTALPIGESIALKLGKVKGFAYSHARLWGSIAFVAVTVLAGFAFSEFGLGLTPFFLIIFLALSAYIALQIKTAKPESRAPLRFSDIGKLCRNKGYIYIVMAGALSQATHAAYYSFGSVIWEGLGYSSGLIGLLWAIGVIAEIILFRYFPGEKWRPETLLVLGAMAGIARWGIMAGEPPLLMVAGLQILHAFTFGAAHLGAVHGVQKLSGSLQATAQTIYAVMQGFAMTLAIYLAGQIFEEQGSVVYAIMAAFSSAALMFGLLAFREMAKND